MDLQETIEYVKQFYKQEIKSYYDDKCIRSIKIVFKEGEIFPYAVITYDKVCLDIKNDGISYVKLTPTEEKIHINRIKEKLSFPVMIEESQLEFLRHASVLKNLNRENNGFDEYMQSLIDLTGYTREEIMKKAGL